MALGRESDRGLRWALAALVGLLVVSTTAIPIAYFTDMLISRRLATTAGGARRLRRWATW